jgi:hypothetical protein|tara:strand:+ start:631 stop:795 length:165 start_codon:yes stop_codon:yes gene_type:complete
MEYQHALQLMEETVAHRVLQLRGRAKEQDTLEARRAMERRAQEVQDAFDKVRNG